ncbi:MAG: NAD(P)/FAD-dependent oxidoreductase, partial [Muribaculaceae bacterium]|nr:NAD(P)/FAD-dependent oxidoreductase [Muribaculaceae bacterium]
MKKSVVIIGAGVGGLFTGAILAKEGMKVTVLEKNATIGGGLQTFTRFGECFDTGMHVVGGMRPNGNIYKICKYLGIIDQINLSYVDDDCSDMLYFGEDKSRYAIAQGRERFVDSLATYFPAERENLQRYTDAIFSIAGSVDLFNLRPSKGNISILMQKDDYLMAANEFIANYIGDKRLRSVLAYMNPLYGGKGNITPAYIHAIISVLYINGTSRFKGGSGQFADLLAGVITQNGGEVLAGDGVEWIEVSDRNVEFVRTKKGRVFTADYYISSIHPCTMLNLMDEKAFPKSYRERLNEIPNAYSAFSLYIKLKPDSFPYINHSEYYMSRYADIWNFDNPGSSWPLGFLFMTPPEENQGQYATKALVTAPMPWEMVKQWENTTVEHRGEEYLRWKEEKTRCLLSLIEEIHKDFGNCIDKMLSSSPLTIRDFYGVKEGSISGFSKDCNNIAMSQVPVVTKIKNL